MFKLFANTRPRLIVANSYGKGIQPPEYLDSKLDPWPGAFMSDVVRPSDVSGMTEEDTTEHSSSIPSSAIGARSNKEIIAEANAAKDYSPDDPIAGRILTDEDVPGFYDNTRPSKLKITGTIDPVFSKSGFTIGDRIYHKKLKEEGKVVDLLASGSVIVKLDNGKKGITAAANLVKL